jgi:hypothetical protein
MWSVGNKRQHTLRIGGRDIFPALTFLVLLEKIYEYVVERVKSWEVKKVKR